MRSRGFRAFEASGHELPLRLHDKICNLKTVSKPWGKTLI